jgi:hypothetical protein
MPDNGPAVTVLKPGAHNRYFVDAPSKELKQSGILPRYSQAPTPKKLSPGGLKTPVVIEVDLLVLYIQQQRTVLDDTGCVIGRGKCRY